MCRSTSAEIPWTSSGCSTRPSATPAGTAREARPCGNHDSASGTSGNHAGNRAVERGQGANGGTGKHRASGDNGGGATAEGYTQGSPGLLSGNQIQAPIDIPVNVCGNSIDVVGLLNPTFGNECENESTPPVDVPEPPVRHVTPPTPEPHVPNVPEPQTPPEAPQLAHTGAGGLDVLIPASAGLLLMRRGHSALPSRQGRRLTAEGATGRANGPRGDRGARFVCSDGLWPVGPAHHVARS